MFSTQNGKLSARQRIERANVALLGNLHTVEYSGVIMVGSYEIRKDVSTARTNGIDVHYGEDFILSLKDEEIRGVIMHETLHKTFQHVFLWKHLLKQDPECANQAVDHVVNLIIKDIEQASGGFITLPANPPPLADPRFKDMDSGEIFRILLAEKQQQNGEDKGEQGDGKKGKQQASQGGGGGEPLDEHDWGGAEAMSKEEATANQREIDQAIRQGQLLAGKMKGTQSRVLGDLTTPAENWREQLSDYLTSQSTGGDVSTWRKVNRRWLQHDMYMPTTLDETLGSIVIAIDTSGSIDDRAINEFLSHVRVICTNLVPERVDLLYWDTDVAGHEVYKKEELDKLVHNTKPRGGGGTQVDCVFEYIEKVKLNPIVVLIMTDGYTPYPSVFARPVLWAMTSNVQAPWGKTIYIK